MFASRNPPRVQTLPNPTGPKGASAALIVKIDDDDNDDIENDAHSDNHYQHRHLRVQTLPNPRGRKVHQLLSVSNEVKYKIATEGK